MAVRAQRRSVTTSGLTEATFRVPGLVGRTWARPAGDAGGDEGGVVPGVVLGVVGTVVVGIGARAARNWVVAGAVGVAGGGGGGAERVVVGGDVGGLVGVVGGGGGLVGGGGGGGWVCGGPSPMLMQMIGSRQIRKSGAMTCCLPTEPAEPTETAASAAGATARNRMGTATTTPPILASIRPLLPDGDSVRPVSCE
jgi:hypothetical protein